MPRANPNASFEVAARHLFRHLNDAKELKRNPLVKKYFDNRAGTTNLDDRTILILWTRIHAAAKDYRVNAPRDKEAAIQRRLAVLAGCLQGRSVKQLAHSLGISLRQCYRERSLIYRYVGEALRRDTLSPVGPIVHIEDAFESQMERAAVRVRNGDYALAMRQYDSLIAEGSARQKCRALVRRGELELELGFLSSAESSLEALSMLVAEAAEGEALYGESVAVQLLQARLAWDKGKFSEAVAKLSLARAASAEFKDGPSERLRCIYADIALESAKRAFDLGDFDAAKSFIVEAKHASEATTVPHERLANILLTESCLGFASTRPGEDIPKHGPIALAAMAHSAAVQCGSIKWRLKAELFLIALQRSSLDVLQRGLLILSLANELQNAPLFALLSLELADLLLETPSWRRAEGVMDVTVPDGSFYAGSFSMLKAAYHLKARAPSAAKHHAKVAHALASRAGAPRFQASTLRLLGFCSYLLGERDEATDYISLAVPLAERFASAPARLKTLRTAARITGRRKYAKEAAKLASAIR